MNCPKCNILRESIEDLFCGNCGFRFEDRIDQHGQSAFDTEESVSEPNKLAASENKLNISDNYIKSSEINLNQDSTSSGHEAKSCDGSTFNLSDSFIKDSVINVDQSSHTVIQNTHITIVEEQSKKEKEYVNILHSYLRSYGTDAIFTCGAELDRQAKNLGLDDQIMMRINHEFVDQFIRQKALFEERERTRKKYRLKGTDRLLTADIKNLSEVIQYLNTMKFFNFVPTADTDQNGRFQSVWCIREIFDHPDLLFHCSLSGSRIPREVVRICCQCGKIVHMKYMNNLGFCQKCEAKRKTEKSSDLSIGKSTIYILQAIEELRKSNNWVKISENTFFMGSNENESSRSSEEILHRVKLSGDILVLKNPVTDIVLNNLLKKDTSGKELPVVNISWLDAVKMCNELSRKNGFDECYKINPDDSAEIIWDKGKYGIRLLTEAEWEYCCRAGSAGPNYLENQDELYKIALYDSDDIEPSGLKEPNKYGLYDMLGLVWEWVYDGRYEYTRDDIRNPVGNPSNVLKILRGGSYLEDEFNCRSSVRKFYNYKSKRNDIGFRICISLP